MVEKIPTAAQKAFGPGTPRDEEKCGGLLHGSDIDLNIQLSDANLVTAEKIIVKRPLKCEIARIRLFNAAHLCENIVRLAQDPSGVCVRCHEEFECADVHVCA